MSESMRTLNIPPMTPAQRDWDDAIPFVPSAGVVRIAFNRAEEVAASVAALAETVAELDRESTRRHYEWLDATRELSDRLAALESPAAAPEPVCQCGHPKTQHFAMSGSCFNVIHEFKTETASGHVTCGCLSYVPAEPAAAVPDAAPTDKVLDKIVDLYLIMFPVRNEAPSSQIEMGLRDEFGRRTGIGPGWETVDAAIRAYGRDGAS